MEIALILLVILAVVGIATWVIYNRLVTANIRVEEAWSDITVQLKRRADLIPNLVTVSYTHLTLPTIYSV